MKCVMFLGLNFIFWYLCVITAGECKANQYHCHNGDCIDGSYVCDGYNDCIDASDELNCGNV
jgi:hypothetical protein